MATLNSRALRVDPERIILIVRHEDMKRTCSILLLASALASCSRPPAFPPTDVAGLQRYVSQFVPSLKIISSGETLHAKRLPVRGSSYGGLHSHFFAFSCDTSGAEHLLGRDGGLFDNSIVIDTNRLTIGVDRQDNGYAPDIVPPDMAKTRVYPSVFYETLDLSRCDTLHIRTVGAPTWYAPHSIGSGLADRCVWGRGRVLTEFYFDADRQMMYMRIDELRPN